MSVKKKIIVLTSRDNFVWTSMQEIIPMIESTWEDYSKKYDYDLFQINVDQAKPSKFIRDLIESDLIVVTCFNLKIAHFIKTIRNDFKIDTRIFFYLHGLATIALWPLSRFGILPLLKSNDVFIGTCEGDLKSLKITIPNASSAKIPFTLNEFKFLENPSMKEHTPFVYIGRISKQKNLESLIIAYSRLDINLRKKHPLFLYGKEDHLGYPNLGILEESYQAKLQSIVDLEGLGDSVIFKGFVDRSEIQKELGSSYIFISCSTHSDENFGMAAFRALLSGAYAILTSWGGHKEFREPFLDRVNYIDPSLNINEITDSLLKAVAIEPRLPQALPEKFTQDKIFSQFQELMDKQEEASSLLTSTLAKTVHEQQLYFESHGQIQRCFKSFEDPAFISFYEAYL